MKLLTALLVLGAAMAPVPAAALTVEQTAVLGYSAGQVLCTLKRHGAPQAVVDEELRRLGADAFRLTKRQLSEAEVDQIFGVAASVLKTCPPRALPDA